MDTDRKQSMNRHLYACVKALTSAIEHAMDAQNESTGSPPLSALQHAEQVLKLIDQARQSALGVVARLRAEYTAQGGEPR